MHVLALVRRSIDPSERHAAGHENSCAGAGASCFPAAGLVDGNQPRRLLRRRTDRMDARDAQLAHVLFGSSSTLPPGKSPESLAGTILGSAS